MSHPEDAATDGAATSIRQRAVTGVASLALREAAIRGLGLLGNLVLARLLVPSEFGAVAFGYTLMGFSSLIADGGLGAALVGRADRPSNGELRALLGFHLMATSAAVLLIATTSAFLGQVGVLATVMALSLPLSALKLPGALMLEREMDYRLIVRSDIAEILVYNVSAIALVALGFGVWGVAVAVVLRMATGAVLVMTFGPVGWLLPRASFSTIRPLLRFGLQFQGVNIIGTLRDQGLNLLAAGVGGLAVLGIWSFAGRLLQGIFLILNQLWRVSFPAISRLLSTKAPIVPALERSLEISSTALGFVVLAIGGAAPALVPTLFTARWNQAVAVLPWCAAGLMTAGPVSTTAVGYFFATGRGLFLVRAAIIHTLVWYAVSAPLIPSLGAEALGIGNFAGTIADVLILAPALGREGVSVIRSCGVPTIGALAGGAAAWLVATVGPPNLFTLAASLLTGEGAYVGLLYVFRRSALLDLARLTRRTLRPSRPIEAH